MRLTVGTLLLILLMYLGGTSIVAARARAVHTWHGKGAPQTIHFSMPAGPVQGVMSRPWTLGYSLSCSGLKHLHGMPPNTYLKPTFHFSLTGSAPLGYSMGMDSGDNRAHARWHTYFGNGGTFTLDITALPTCVWTMTAASR